MKTRRALSTVVGGVFFLAVIMTAASYLTYSMDLFDNFSQTVFVVEQERENRKKEVFEVSNFAINNNKFNMTIQNLGDVPIEFSRIWIQNTTGTDQVYKFSLNQTLPVGSVIKNIGQGIGLTALDTETYEIKLVTERGNTRTFLVNSANEPLNIQLFAMPEEVPNNFKTTLLMAVTNNATKDILLANIKPVLTPVSLGATATLESIEPKAYPLLNEGDTAFFEWTYRIEGKDGDKTRFTASIENGILGNTVTKEVEVQKIDFADQSGGSLETNLLAGGSILEKDVLLFHSETIDALGERQMWSSAAEDSTGEIIDFGTVQSAVFYTNTDGNVTVNIPDGNWNATLRYISSPVPDSLIHSGSSAETMAYHFALDEDNPTDSTGNTLMTLGTGAARPIWESNGHHGSGSYSFSGAQYASILVTSDIDIQDSPASTSAWFKASSSGPVLDQYIIRGENNLGTKFYEVFLNGLGNLVFQIDTGSTVTQCVSSSVYKDDNWHHFVAVMPDDNDCRLYVDGVLRDSKSVSGNSNLSLNGNVYVGARDGTGLFGFHGSIDDIIHWDDYALIEDVSEKEVTDLYNTNYGIDAHKFDFEIKIVDQFGNDLINPDKNIINSNNYSLPFMSDFGEYSSPITDIWGQFNFTAQVIDSKIIDPSERLMYNMTIIPKPLGNLPLKFVIDDTDITSNLGNSFLQTPFPDVSYPGYFTYDNAGRGQLNIFNPTEKGHFINYLSRVVFEEEITKVTYAAYIDQNGNEAINSNQDSPLIPSNQTSTFEFEKPRSQPGNTSSELIPEGRYRLHVFLNGYDQTGQSFLKTTLVGVVRVI